MHTIDQFDKFVKECVFRTYCTAHQSQNGFIAADAILILICVLAEQTQHLFIDLHKMHMLRMN